MSSFPESEIGGGVSVRLEGALAVLVIDSNEIALDAEMLEALKRWAFATRLLSVSPEVQAKRREVIDALIENIDATHRVGGSLTSRSVAVDTSLRLLEAIDRGER